ncbi:chaplin [Kitasatospora sp. HPMI-4]|uniref:chaplin n=1 Tax=Kitasatospora sp. HPMI-4 TaxID=3448443 RepID=UPI003F1A7256
MRIRTALVAASLAATALLAGAQTATADSDAEGAAVGSPGVISGNNIQVPIQLPINLCGNSVDIVGLLNAAAGNACVNKS